MKKVLVLVLCLSNVLTFSQIKEEISPSVIDSSKVVRVLKGKALGVNIAPTSGLSLKSMPSQLNYKKSEQQQPLFVIDGILFNSVPDYGNFTDGMSNTSSRFLDLDSNNIESISILKGEEAIALYGLAGKNGVVLVTSKDPYSESNQNRLKLMKEQARDNSNKREISITGIITDCEGILIENVEIKNINSKKSYKTDSLGKYSIIVNKNDYILFKKDNFYIQKFKVVRQKIIDIKMKMIPIPVYDSNNIIIKKPVIYLYPKEKIDITLQIDFRGKLLTTFPKYDNEWKVTAFPDGKILDKKSNRYYTSLFWDGEIKFPQEHYNYQSGFEVSKNDLTEFLIEKLEILGLNTFETNDFVQYWLPILEKNQTNFIHFLVNEDYNVISLNNIFPKPDTQIRIFMEFYKLENKTNLPEQKLERKIRDGFTVVEWGGSDVSSEMKFKL